jgi:hypothetical protein
VRLALVQRLSETHNIWTATVRRYRDPSDKVPLPSDAPPSPTARLGTTEWTRPGPNQSAETARPSSTPLAQQFLTMLIAPSGGATQVSSTTTPAEGRAGLPIPRAEGYNRNIQRLNEEEALRTWGPMLDSLLDIKLRRERRRNASFTLADVHAMLEAGPRESWNDAFESEGMSEAEAEHMSDKMFHNVDAKFWLGAISETVVRKMIVGWMRSAPSH